MATSIVEICNAALILIGENTIENATLGTDTDAEIQCSIMFPIIRDKVLREHPWNFAETRQVVASLVETPAFEFSTYYTLPSDCIRVLRLYDTDYSYRVEGNRRIATDSPSCNLIYTARVTDPAQFDAGFVSVLIYRLGAHLGRVLNGNHTLSDTLDQKADSELRAAKVYDAQEGTPYKRTTSGGWTTKRT